MTRLADALSKLGLRKRAYAILVLCATTAIAAPAQTQINTLFSFSGSNGLHPNTAPVQGTSGPGYGTTFGGGEYGFGTVFTTTPKLASEKTIYSFCPGVKANCKDGANPTAGLYLAPDLNFYGTTLLGGLYGGGTVFKMNSSGKLTPIYSFCAKPNCADGENPQAGIARAGSTGLLYGTTFGGGANGGGTIFQLDSTSGTLTPMIYSFCALPNCMDGQGPVVTLVESGRGGNYLYGTTTGGGANGLGTIFKITPSGTLTTLYSFGGTDGQYPWGLVVGADENFYGTTEIGGAFNSGTIFEWNPSGGSNGGFSKEYDFCSDTGCLNGGFPLAGFILASDLNLYGTTSAYGTYGQGTIFQFNPNTPGVVTMEYSFCIQTGCPDGLGPNILTQATDGLFFGTTFGGGASGDGTIFSLNLGLAQFVETLPQTGKVGSKVTILAPGLMGVTSITFNGTSQLSFAVDSSGSEITTTVPAGATGSGPVVVFTSSGMFKTFKNFTVLP
jgi:uncharacterized repeat protein (TIGR03803 family)